MKKLPAFIGLIFFTAWLLAAERKWAPLPVALANNAVTSMKVDKQLVLFSFMGIGVKKTWNTVTNRSFGLNTETGEWTEYRPVPGPAGRLAASAVSVKDVIYLLGGYTVDRRGEESAVRSVEVLLPSKDIWYRGEDMPTPLADFVAGQYRDRYVYTIGGLSRGNPLNSVQVYDAEKNTWKTATPSPGSPVFGSAGALVEDTIIYIDGARKNPAGEKPKFVASDECWMGKIDHHDPTKIQWSKIDGNPGKARFHIAAGISKRDHKIYFSGGTDNPSDFRGVGYDGHPAQPSPTIFAWDLRTSKWQVVSENAPTPVMDSRALLVVPQGLVLIGGMEKDQKILSRVTIWTRQ